MNDTQISVAQGGAKIASAWAAVGLTSWADVASALAALYTVILIFEWVWKKFLRPGLETKGYIKRLKRRRDDDCKDEC